MADRLIELEPCPLRSDFAQLAKAVGLKLLAVEIIFPSKTELRSPKRFTKAPKLEISSSYGRLHISLDAWQMLTSEELLALVAWKLAEESKALEKLFVYSDSSLWNLVFFPIVRLLVLLFVFILLPPLGCLLLFIALGVSMMKLYTPESRNMQDKSEADPEIIERAMTARSQIDPTQAANKETFLIAVVCWKLYVLESGQSGRFAKTSPENMMARARNWRLLSNYKETATPEAYEEFEIRLMTRLDDVRNYRRVGYTSP